MKLSNFDINNKSGIYKIVNLKTGTFYIGSTKDFLRRFKEHSKALTMGTHPNVYLQSSFNKHGSTHFEFEIVEPVAVNNLLMIEQVYLDWYSNTETFNLSGLAHRVEHTEEVRKKISLANTGRPSSLKGVKRTEDVKEKISEANTGKVRSEDSRQKMREAFEVNKEHRLALLRQNHETMRGKVQSEKERRNSEIAGYRAAFKHRKISDRDVLNFIARFTSEPKFIASTFAKEKGVSTSTIANVFKKLKSKNNDYLAVFKPILFKIGYIDANGDSVTDLKNSEFLAKLDLNIEFTEGSDNLINDPVELFNFIHKQD